MPPIRVLIAEDETIVRYALGRLLGAEEDINIVGEVPNGAAAVVAARERRPDVILMDIEMPKMTGIEATWEIKEEMPECAVVVLTVYDDDERLLNALKAGAIGYVLKDSPPEQTTQAIRAAARGEGFLSAPLIARVLDAFREISERTDALKEELALLTKREMEVLELVREGLRNKEIAARLFISVKTVKNHVSSILAKLQANHRYELIRQFGSLSLAHSPRSSASKAQEDTDA